MNQSLRHQHDELITEDDPNTITLFDVRTALEYNVLPRLNAPYSSPELRELVKRYHAAYDEMQEIKKQLSRMKR